MDVRYINPFITSVQNVFKTSLATDVVISKPLIKAVDEEFADVSAVLGLSGDATGCVVLSLPMNTAVKVAGKFTGLEMNSQNDRFSVALSELANMVAGQAKPQLNDLNMTISIPTVIVGKEQVVSQAKLAPRLALPCDSMLGRFCVDVVMLTARKSMPVSADA